MFQSVMRGIDKSPILQSHRKSLAKLISKITTKYTFKKTSNTTLIEYF